MSWRGGHRGAPDTKRKLSLRKRHAFVNIGQYFGDIIWGQNFAPDLLESIMKPTDPVKEELRRKAMKINQIRSKILGFGGFNF